MTDQQPDDRTAARRAGDPETWDAKVLNDLMMTPQGRYWMERLLDKTATVGGFGGDGTSIALGLAWRAGGAEVGGYLEGQLQDHCPDLYVRMIRERRERAARAIEKEARAQRRQDGQPFEHSGYTMMDGLAEKQRVEAEAEAAKAKKKPKNDA